jgi:hypothetical protein
MACEKTGVVSDAGVRRWLWPSLIAAASLVVLASAHASVGGPEVVPRRALISRPPHDLADTFARICHSRTRPLSRGLLGKC